MRCSVNAAGLAMPPLLLLLLLLLQLVAVVQAQLYFPRPALLSCPAGQTLYSYGDTDADSYYCNAATFGTTPAVCPPDVQDCYCYQPDVLLDYSWLSTAMFNGSQYNATIAQLSVGLLATTGNPWPAHLRMELFAYSSQLNVLTLLGQSEEVTLYPGPATVVYADLIGGPVPLPLGGYYGIAVWTDTAPLPTAYGSYTQPNAELRQFEYTGYNPYPFPATIYPSGSSLYASGYGAAAPLAATGCVTPSVDPFLDPANTVFSFAALLESRLSIAPSPSSSQQAANTLMTSYCGLLAVQRSSAATASFGSYYTVVAAQGVKSLERTSSNSQLPAAAQRVVLHAAAADISLLPAFVLCCVASLQSTAWSVCRHPSRWAGRS